MTIVSLVLNALIIVLLLVGAIIHHHQMHRGFADRRDRFEGFQDRGFGPGAGRYGMMGMNQGWNGSQGFHGGPGPMGGGPDMMGREKGGPPDPAQMSQNILDHLSQKLSLTDDEKAKIKPIVDQQVADIQKQMEAVRESVKKQLEAQHEAMKQHIEDSKAKIRPLLTADQQKELDELNLTGPKPGE